jgi:hypothetical protein
LGHSSDRQSIGRQFVEISAASRDQYYAAIANVCDLFSRKPDPILPHPKIAHSPLFASQQHLQEQEGARLALSAGSSSIGRDEGVAEEQRQFGASILWTGTAAPTPPSKVIAPIGTSPGYVDPLHPASAQHLSQQQPIAPQQQLAGPPSIAMSESGASESSRPTLHAPMAKRAGGGIQVGDHTGFLRMRGLPFSTTKEEIFHFFEGLNPVQESIVLTFRNDGRATGEAYIGFASPEDSKRAMELNRRMMGSRYIELFISNKDEQGRALARFGNR